MGYQLKGDILEVCNCKTLCPCWIGEDPDNGSCEAAMAYRIETGQIGGVDVSGLNIGIAAFIPGNVFSGGFRVIRYVDDRASLEQEQALLEAFRGKLGGPLADLANLVGEEVAARRAPIRFSVEKGRGILRMARASPPTWSPIAADRRADANWSRASFRRSRARPPTSRKPLASGWSSPKSA